LGFRVPVGSGHHRGESQAASLDLLPDEPAGLPDFQEARLLKQYEEAKCLQRDMAFMSTSSSGTRTSGEEAKGIGIHRIHWMKQGKKGIGGGKKRYGDVRRTKKCTVKE
jgi:hypothetical protein